MEQNPAGFPPRRRRIQAVCFGVKCSETPSSTWSLPKSAGAGDALSWPWVPWVQAGQPHWFAAHTSPGKAWPLPLSPPEMLFLRAWTKPAFFFLSGGWLWEGSLPYRGAPLCHLPKGKRTHPGLFTAQITVSDLSLASPEMYQREFWPGTA